MGPVELGYDLAPVDLLRRSPLSARMGLLRDVEDNGHTAARRRPIVSSQVAHDRIIAVEIFLGPDHCKPERLKCGHF